MDKLEAAALPVSLALDMSRNGHDVKLVWPSAKQATLTFPALKLWICHYGTAVVTVDGFRYFLRLETVP